MQPGTGILRPRERVAGGVFPMTRGSARQWKLGRVSLSASCNVVVKIVHLHDVCLDFFSKLRRGSVPALRLPLGCFQTPPAFVGVYLPIHSPVAA